MTRAAIFLAAFLAATPTAARDIYHDGGGHIIDYALRYARQEYRPWRVLGYCASACTMVLQYSDTCVGPGARLMFHTPTPAKFRYILRRYYPRDILRWYDMYVRDHRLLPLDKRLMAKLPRCKL